MAVATERLTLNSIKRGQKEGFKGIQSRDFPPFEITRDSYLLPSLPGRRLRFLDGSISAGQALEKTIERNGRVRVLDLGCGAGFWLQEQKERYGEGFEGYGISACSYRTPEERPLLVPTGKWGEVNGEKVPTLKQPNYPSEYVECPLLLQIVKIDDTHYREGDVHDLLRQFPSEEFDIVVSYQAFQYFFDPLRVLKGVYRVLKRGGVAFLESLEPAVFDYQGKPLSVKKLEEVFRQNGYEAFVGEYYPTPHHHRRGLSLKKGEKPRLNLPFSYSQIIYSGKDAVSKVTYQLNGR